MESTYGFLCRVLRVQKHKEWCFLYVSGFQPSRQIMMDINLMRKHQIAEFSIVKGICEESKNKEGTTIYRVLELQDHVRSGIHGIDIMRFTNQTLAYRQCRYAIMNEIEAWLRKERFQRISSPFTMKYRGTSIATPLHINGKFVDRYCKITHELGLKQAMSEIMAPVYEIGYVANDIYTTKIKWFEYTVLEFVSPLHDESFIGEFILQCIQIATKITDEYGLKHADFANIQVIDLNDGTSAEEVAYLRYNEPNVLIMHSPTASPLVKMRDGKRTETIWYFKGSSMAHGYADENDWSNFLKVSQNQIPILASKGELGQISEDFISLLKAGIPNSVSLGMGIDRFFQVFFEFSTIKDYRECMFPEFEFYK